MATYCRALFIVRTISRHITLADVGTTETGGKLFVCMLYWRPVSSVREKTKREKLALAKINQSKYLCLRNALTSNSVSFFSRLDRHTRCIAFRTACVCVCVLPTCFLAGGGHNVRARVSAFLLVCNADRAHRHSHAHSTRTAVPFRRRFLLLSRSHSLSCVLALATNVNVCSSLLVSSVRRALIISSIVR